MRRRLPAIKAGTQIYSWTVLRRASRSKTGAARWRCRCSCGSVHTVHESALKQALYGPQMGSRRCKTHRTADLRGVPMAPTKFMVNVNWTGFQNPIEAQRFADLIYKIGENIRVHQPVAKEMTV